MTDRYEDIMMLDRPVSKNHPPMSRLARAAQFAPFAALRGYDDAICEEARDTETAEETSDEQKLEIGKTLVNLYQKLKHGKEPRVLITYFVKDATKTGGAYLKEELEISKVNLTERLIYFKDGKTVHAENIREIVEISR
ncbi:MAG: hypothetical protein CW338_11955 [Clostridiales bacterium]|nr:hypothetical protein [Clostridiales bacterium]